MAFEHKRTMSRDCAKVYHPWRIQSNDIRSFQEAVDGVIAPRIFRIYLDRSSGEIPL